MMSELAVKLLELINDNYKKLDKSVYEKYSFECKSCETGYYLNSNKKYTVDLNKLFGPDRISYDIPKFWVIYRFQYRDAQNLEFYGDLITHTPPEGHYKVGDPITCMADISSLGDKQSRLSVVPYPYPFGDVMNQDEILFSCDMDNKVLNNGDIMECDKQLELYCLSSIPYIHDNTVHDVVEIIPGKHLNYPTAMEFYKKLVEQLKQKSGDDEDRLIRIVKLHRDKLKNKQSADKLYFQLIEEHYHYKSQFKAGDDEAILKAAEIYRDILADDIEYTNCHRLFAKRYLPKPDANADEMKSAIENYQSKLKYESERICWEMIVMIWMDDYGLTIEKIWDKLKASYGFIYSSDFSHGMFTAFSYFNEDWLEAHQFDPEKAYKHIRSWNGTYDDHHMKGLREIWEYKKKYQNGDKEVAFDLHSNYSICFEAYSDAIRLWRNDGTELREAWQKWFQIERSVFGLMLMEEWTEPQASLLSGAEKQELIGTAVKNEAPLYLPQSAVDYVLCGGSDFSEGKMRIYRQFTESLSKEELKLFMNTNFVNPNANFAVSLLTSVLGVDRFVIGQTDIGLLKLLTAGGIGIWAIIDWFQIKTLTKEYNFNKAEEIIDIIKG